MRILIALFLFLGACDLGGWPDVDKSCKAYCYAIEYGGLQEKMSAPSLTKGASCYYMKLEAYKKAQKSGYCYNGPLIKGKDKGAIDPDPDKCKAAWYSAQKKCDSLPPDSYKCTVLINGSLKDCEKLHFDPSMLREPIELTFYNENGKRIDWTGFKRVINGEVCDCNIPPCPTPPGRSICESIIEEGHNK